MSTQKHLTTAQAASRLNRSSASLRTKLARHPELRPAWRLDSGDWMWTTEEITRIADHYATAKAGRPAKN